MKLRIYYYDEQGNEQFDDYIEAVGIHMDHYHDELTVLAANKTTSYQLSKVFGIQNT